VLALDEVVSHAGVELVEEEGRVKHWGFGVLKVLTWVRRRRVKTMRSALRASYTVPGRGVRRFYKRNLVVLGVRTRVDGGRELAEEAKCSGSGGEEEAEREEGEDVEEAIETYEETETHAALES
jgi:hypothetical protein